MRNTAMYAIKILLGVLSDIFSATAPALGCRTKCRPPSKTWLQAYIAKCCSRYHRAAMLYLLPFCAAVLLFASCGNPLVNESVIGVTYYDVTFNTDGGAFVETFAAVQTVEKGKSVTRPPTIKKEGFTFGGWFTDGDYAEETEWDFHMLVLRNMTLYPKWDKIPYVVYYTVYLWDADDLLVEWEAAANTHINPPELPPKTGYNFDYWYTIGLNAENDPIKIEWDFETDIISGELHMHLQWDPIAYSVAYFANDIDVNGNALAETPSGDMEPTPVRRYDDGIALPAVEFAITGYTFTGWNTEPDGSGVSWGVEAIGNLTDEDYRMVPLYAQWAPNRHILTFDPMGGNWGIAGNGETFIDIQVVEVVYNETLAPPQAPVQELPPGLYRGTLDGLYPFAGWFKDRDYTAQWNFAADTIPDESITLYAKWNSEDYVAELYDFDEMGGFGHYYNKIDWALDYIRRGFNADYDYTLLLDEDVSAPGFSIDADITLTLIGSGGERKISITDPGTLFTVVGNFTLGNNITLVGLTAGVNGAVRDNNAPLVYVTPAAIFTMLDGSKITGNTNVGASYSFTQTTGAGSTSYDAFATTAAVLVGVPHGEITTFIMKGGTITGNRSYGDCSSYPGGTSEPTATVFLCSMAELIMSGGSITGNEQYAGNGDWVPMDVGMGIFADMIEATVFFGYAELVLDGDAVLGNVVMEKAAIHDWQPEMRIVPGWNGRVESVDVAFGEVWIGEPGSASAYDAGWKKAVVRAALGYIIGAEEVHRVTLSNPAYRLVDSGVYLGWLEANN